jgi:hypothetical protein
MDNARSGPGRIEEINMSKHFKRTFILGISLVVLACGLALSVTAQTVSGTLRGTITDSNGAVIPNATVTVRNKETGLVRTVTSSDEGLYNITFLPIGGYEVTATRTDFNKVTRSEVTVNLNENTVVNITLSPTVSGEVTVADETPPINTTNAQIAGTLSTSQIEERPVANQGSFLTLAETFTGFQENPISGQNNPTASSGSSINFNGTGTRGATFQINGVNNDDSSENQNRQGASLATIKAFQVITNNYTAEFGRGYGAVVLVQTKQGTNAFKGEAYWYNQNSALNSKSFFTTVKPVNRRNQFGAVLGFPIVKNKLFGFVSFDHTEDTGAGNITRDIFTPAEKNPANWFNRTPANNTPANRAFIQSVLNRFGDLVPNDSRSPRTWSGVQGRTFPDRDYSARFDWNPNQTDSILGRWQYTRQRRDAEDIILGERADQNHKQQNYGLTWTHIFSPEVVGEFRYGMGLRTTLVNITAGNDTPVIRFFNPAAVAGTTIGNATAFPIQRYQTDNQFVYNVSATFGGSHFLKSGVDIRLQKLDDLADAGSRGFYQFGVTTSTCNAFAYASGFEMFLNGCVSQFSKAYGPFFLENRLGEYNVYIEDNWKIRPNLTLNLGARYEYVNAPRERQGRIEYGFSDDNNNIEPRIGFAYSPSFSSGWLTALFGKPDESSIRGGYGIYHGRIFQSVFSQGTGATVRFNPPNAFNYSQTGVATSLFNPVNLQDPTNGFVFVPGEPTIRYSVAIPDKDLEVPYTQQWNLSYERQLPWASAIRVSYTGNRGIGLLRFVQDNLPAHDPVNGVRVPDHPNNPAALRGQIIRLAADAQCAGTTAATVSTLCPVPVTLGAFEYSRITPRTNERRPNGKFGTNLLIGNGSWSYYNALQVEYTKRLSSGLSFQAAYTWSKAIDTTSEATALNVADSNFNGPSSRISRGYSLFHSPQRFTLFGTYRLPWFAARKDIVGQVLGGWQTSVVLKLVRGTPFTITGAAGDLNFDSVAESRPVILNPSILGSSISNPATSRQMLVSSDFRQPTLADFGCCIIGRNTFFGDGVNNVDLALSKSFAMPFEGHRLSVRADMFNAFNRIRYGLPNRTFNAAAFGTINTAVNAARVVQVSLRYSF